MKTPRIKPAKNEISNVNERTMLDDLGIAEGADIEDTIPILNIKHSENESSKQDCEVEQTMLDDLGIEEVADIDDTIPILGIKHSENEAFKQSCEVEQTMLDDLGIEDAIPLSDDEITGSVFNKAMEWCEKYKGHPENKLIHHDSNEFSQNQELSIITSEKPSNNNDKKKKRFSCPHCDTYHRNGRAKIIKHIKKKHFPRYICSILKIKKNITVV